MRCPVGDEDTAGAGVAATLYPIVTGERTWALIDLDDADLVSIRNVHLRDAQRGILVQNGSDDLDLDHIEAWGHSQEGIRVDTTADLKAWDDITVHDNASTGLWVDGPLSGLSNVLSYSNNGYGLYLTGSLESLTESEFHHNTSGGAYLSNVGATTIQASSFHDNTRSGLMFYSAAGGLVGSENLSLGLGNTAYNNTHQGLYVSGAALVAGNTVWGNSQDGIDVSGGEARANVAHDNRLGIRVSSGIDTFNS